MEQKAPDPSQANISYGNALNNAMHARHQNSNEPRDVIVTTPEDLQILNECSSEALWSKSIPLAIAMGGSVLFLGKTGKIAGTSVEKNVSVEKFWH